MSVFKYLRSSKPPYSIEHYAIKVTWSDGKEEFLDDIPYNKSMEYYLDCLEEERNNDEEAN